MITLILSAKTTPTRPRADAMAHLKSVHGPMVYDAPADAGAMPSIYVQNHVRHDPRLPDALAAMAWDRDLVTEISFENVAHLGASTATPYYLEHLKLDEGQFVDQSSVRPLVVTVERLGPSEVEATGKLFVYLKAAGDLEAFEARWHAATRACQPLALAQALNRPLRQPGTPPAFVDGIWSLWFDDPIRAQAFCEQYLPQLLTEFGDTIDQAASHVVVAEEYSVARLCVENSTASIQRQSA